MPWIAVRTAAVLVLSSAKGRYRYIHSVRLCRHLRCTARPPQQITVPAAAAAMIPVSSRDFDTYAFPSFPYPFLCSFYIMYAAQNCAPFLLQTKKREDLSPTLLYYASRFASVVSSGFLFRISMNSSPVMVSFSSR